MKLNLFTANYPFGFNESYINNELPHLKDSFGQINIYPYEKAGSLQTAFKQQGEVITESEKESKNVLKFSDKLFISKVLFNEFFHMKNKTFFLKKLRRFYAIIKKGVLLSKWIENQSLDPKDAYYSYWMNEWAIALAVLKKKNKIEKFVFRINGYDIWDERHEGNYLPFRYFVYDQMTKVYALSKSSRDYVKALKVFPEKVDFAYYGTKDLGQVKSRNDEQFVIFSCSTAIPLKRIQKIAETVCALDFPVKWHHHGDGPTMESVNDFMKTAPDHITYVNTKKVEDYFAVLEMEKELAPNLFINLSTTEGLPVSIMEALSFGIPILVNDVGSCNEFITEDTGVMVDPNASPESIAAEIKLIKESKDKLKDRDAIRKFWSENFSAEKNYSKFAQDLQTLFK